MAVDPAVGRVKRALFVTTDAPWPDHSGFRQRLHAVLGGLGTAALVDVVLALETVDVTTAVETLLPPGLIYERAQVVHTPSRPRRSKAARWAMSRDPWLFSSLDWREAQDRVAAWVRPVYDVAWFVRVDAFHALRAVVPAERTIVDFADVESTKIGGRLTSRVDQPMAQALLRLDQARWRRTERRVSARASEIVVCRRSDADLFGGPPATVIPNGGQAPAPPYERRPEPNTMIFVGMLAYEPNIDALRFMVEQVLPLVRATIPDAVLTVVGRSPGTWVRSLDRIAGVRIVGEVETVSEYLGRASVAVVPLRYGGGTRVKIVEAFAHGVPVVSTSVGCEGLEVTPGVELLVADEAEDFADACTRLMRDRQTADRLVARAQAFADRSGGWATTSRLVAELVSRLTDR